MLTETINFEKNDFLRYFVLNICFAVKIKQKFLNNYI